MERSNRESEAGRGVVLRSALVGAALAITGLVGVSTIGGGLAPADAAVVIATLLVGLGIGIWAGVPEAEDEKLRLRDRWLAAAALTAVAAAYGTFAALYRQFYPSPIWAAVGLVLGVAVPAYALGLLLPSLVAWGDRLIEDGFTDGAPWGSVGWVVSGTLGGGAVGTLVAGLIALPAIPPASILMVTALVLLLPLLLRGSPAADLRETTLFETVSPFGTLRVTEVAFPGEQQPERRLYLNDEEESGELVRSGAPTLAYIAAAEYWLFATSPAGSSYLFLGGGAYTLPRRVAERDPSARITVVELDPEITRIAYRFFGLRSQHRIHSVHGDARAYLEHPETPTFDRIYVDVYGGDEALPHALVTHEAFESMRRALRPGGLVAINLIGRTQGEEIRQLFSVVRTFEGVFPDLALYTHLGTDYPDRQNLLLVGVHGEERELPASAGRFERWDPRVWPDPVGLTIFRDVTPAMLPPDAHATSPTRRERQA